MRRAGAPLHAPAAPADTTRDTSTRQPQSQSLVRTQHDRAPAAARGTVAPASLIFILPRSNNPAERQQYLSKVAGQHASGSVQRAAGITRQKRSAMRIQKWDLN